MDISMDIHGKSVDMDMDMDGKFHIHGKPDVSRGGHLLGHPPVRELGRGVG